MENTITALNVQKQKYYIYDNTKFKTKYRASGTCIMKIGKCIKNYYFEFRVRV